MVLLKTLYTLWNETMWEMTWSLPPSWITFIMLEISTQAVGEGCEMLARIYTKFRPWIQYHFAMQEALTGAAMEQILCWLPTITG